MITDCLGAKYNSAAAGTQWTQAYIMWPADFLQLVIGMLERRALHSPLTAQPSAHHVLFDFLVAWGNYKHAAAAMLGYARRLRAAAAGGRIAHMTVEDVVHEISAAYGECPGVPFPCSQSGLVLTS